MPSKTHTHLSSPALPDVDFFPIGYAWNDPVLGELESATIVPALDLRAALDSLRSKHPHLTRVWQIQRNPD